MVSQIKVSPKLSDFKKATARDCPSNLMNVMRLFKQGICISTHWLGDSHTILVADKKGFYHKLFGAISCLIVGRIAQFRYQ